MNEIDLIEVYIHVQYKYTEIQELGKRTVYK
jgi:hypothetical protein